MHIESIICISVCITFRVLNGYVFTGIYYKLVVFDIIHICGTYTLWKLKTKYAVIMYWFYYYSLGHLYGDLIKFHNYNGRLT